LQRIEPDIVLDDVSDLIVARVTRVQEPVEERSSRTNILRRRIGAQLLFRLPFDLRRSARSVGFTTGWQTELLDELRILEERVDIEEESYAAIILVVLVLFDDIDLRAVVKAFFFVLREKRSSRRMIDEDRAPEIRDALNELVTFLEKRLSDLDSGNWPLFVRHGEISELGWWICLIFCTRLWNRIWEGNGPFPGHRNFVI